MPLLLAPPDPTTTIFHVTPRHHLAAILRDGVRAGSYWTPHRALLAYYAETIRDDAQEPVVLCCDLATLDVACCEPDWPGIEEPITTVLRSLHGQSRLQDDDIWAAWLTTDKTWRDSLAVVGSLCYRAPIASALLRTTPGDLG